MESRYLALLMFIGLVYAGLPSFYSNGLLFINMEGYNKVYVYGNITGYENYTDLLYFVGENVSNYDINTGTWSGNNDMLYTGSSSGKLGKYVNISGDVKITGKLRRQCGSGTLLYIRDSAGYYYGLGIREYTGFKIMIVNKTTSLIPFLFGSLHYNNYNTDVYDVVLVKNGSQVMIRENWTVDDVNYTWNIMGNITEVGYYAQLGCGVRNFGPLKGIRIMGAVNDSGHIENIENGTFDITEIGKQADIKYTVAGNGGVVAIPLSSGSYYVSNVNYSYCNVNITHDGEINAYDDEVFNITLKGVCSDVYVYYNGNIRNVLSERENITYVVNTGLDKDINISFVINGRTYSFIKNNTRVDFGYGMYLNTSNIQGIGCSNSLDLTYSGYYIGNYKKCVKDGMLRGDMKFKAPGNPYIDNDGYIVILNSSVDGKLIEWDGAHGREYKGVLYGKAKKALLIRRVLSGKTYLEEYYTSFNGTLWDVPRFKDKIRVYLNNSDVSGLVYVYKKENTSITGFSNIEGYVGICKQLNGTKYSDPEPFQQNNNVRISVIDGVSKAAVYPKAFQSNGWSDGVNEFYMKNGSDAYFYDRLGNLYYIPATTFYSNFTTVAALLVGNCIDENISIKPVVRVNFRMIRCKLENNTLNISGVNETLYLYYSYGGNITYLENITSDVIKTGVKEYSLFRAVNYSGVIGMSYICGYKPMDENLKLVFGLPMKIAAIISVAYAMVAPIIIPLGLMLFSHYIESGILVKLYLLALVAGFFIRKKATDSVVDYYVLVGALAITSVLIDTGGVEGYANVNTLMENIVRGIRNIPTEGGILAVLINPSGVIAILGSVLAALFNLPALVVGLFIASLETFMGIEIPGKDVILPFANAIVWITIMFKIIEVLQNRYRKI